MFLGACSNNAPKQSKEVQWVDAENSRFQKLDGLSTKFTEAQANAEAARKATGDYVQWWNSVCVAHNKDELLLPSQPIGKLRCRVKTPEEIAAAAKSAPSAPPVTAASPTAVQKK